jgi:hypothetical protein
VEEPEEEPRNEPIVEVDDQTPSTNVAECSIRSSVAHRSKRGAGVRHVHNRSADCFLVDSTEEEPEEEEPHNEPTVEVDDQTPSTNVAECSIQSAVPHRSKRGAGVRHVHNRSADCFLVDSTEEEPEEEEPQNERVHPVEVVYQSQCEGRQEIGELPGKAEPFPQNNKGL